jgi:hypothetical protein
MKTHGDWRCSSSDSYSRHYIEVSGEALVGPQSWSARDGEEKYLFLLPGIESLFLCHLARRYESSRKVMNCFSNAVSGSCCRRIASNGRMINE